MPNLSVARILIISDNRGRSAELEGLLISAGYDCRRITTAEINSEEIEEFNPDLLLADLDPLWGDGEEGPLIRRLKKRSKTPIIILIDPDALGHFDVAWGLDDFILRPVSGPELIARVRNALWHMSNIDGGNLIKHGDLVLDLVKYEVSVAGRLIDLSFKEYELLKILISNKGRVLNRQTLLDKVWGYDYYGGDRTVDVHIRRLRSKIEDADHEFIQTVRNVGYKFKE